MSDSKTAINYERPDICPGCGYNSDHQTSCCSDLAAAKAEVEKLQADHAMAKLEAIWDRHSRDVMEAEYKRMRDALCDFPAGCKCQVCPDHKNLIDEALSPKPERA